MGKGTKKKTVWRSFSLGDGEANGPTITNGKRTSESPEGKKIFNQSLCFKCI